MFTKFAGRLKSRKSDPIWGKRDLHIGCVVFQDQLSPNQYLSPLILYELLKFTTKYLNYKS